MQDCTREYWPPVKVTQASVCRQLLESPGLPKTEAFVAQNRCHGFWLTNVTVWSVVCTANVRRIKDAEFVVTHRSRWSAQEQVKQRVEERQYCLWYARHLWELIQGEGHPSLTTKMWQRLLTFLYLLWLLIILGQDFLLLVLVTSQGVVGSNGPTFIYDNVLWQNGFCRA